MASETYCIADYHIAGYKDGELKRVTISDEGARLISLDEKRIIIASKKYAIKNSLIENVVVSLVCGNNSRIIFSAKPESALKEGNEMIYTLLVPQKRSITLPNGRIFEYECAPVTKYQEIKKGKNLTGRSSL